MAEPAADSSAHRALELEAVREKWIDDYDVGYVADVAGFPDGAFLARKLTGGPLLTADSPAGLDSAIRGHYARWLEE